MFVIGVRDGNVMVWDIRCNRRFGYFNEFVNIIFNVYVEKVFRVF